MSWGIKNIHNNGWLAPHLQFFEDLLCTISNKDIRHFFNLIV